MIVLFFIMLFIIAIFATPFYLVVRYKIKLQEKTRPPDSVLAQRYYGGDRSGTVTLQTGTLGSTKSLNSSYIIRNYRIKEFNVAANWNIKFDDVEQTHEFLEFATWEDFFFLKNCQVWIDEIDQLSKSGRADEIPEFARWKIGQMRHFNCSLFVVIQTVERCNKYIRDLAHYVSVFEPKIWLTYRNIEGRDIKYPAKVSMLKYDIDDLKKKEKIQPSRKPARSSWLAGIPGLAWLVAEKAGDRVAVKPLSAIDIDFDWATAMRYDTHAVIACDPTLKGSELIAPYMLQFEMEKGLPGMTFTRHTPEKAIAWTALHAQPDDLIDWFTRYYDLFQEFYPDVTKITKKKVDRLKELGYGVKDG